MIDGFRKAAFASRLKIPFIYGLDVVHGVGPVKGAIVFPHNIGLGATRDAALVEQVAPHRRRGRPRLRRGLPLRAGGRGRARRALGPHLRVVRRDHRARAAMGVALTNGFQTPSGPFTVLANAKHYLGDGGTANGVNAGDTSGDETALRAHPPDALPGGGRRRRRVDHGLLQQLAGDPDAHEQDDDHRRAQGRSSASAVSSDPTTTLLQLGVEQAGIGSASTPASTWS